MPQEIVGSLPIKHQVDANGSLALNIPVKVPPSKLAPTVSFAYHSAAKDYDVLGMGWALKSIFVIERVPATVSQDGFRGSINYDSNDRFAVNGQRLIKISSNEYRFEVEKWSKFVAGGSDAANPDSWVEHMSDGGKRYYGVTSDSNVKAQGQQHLTRTWAINEQLDPFENYISYSYDNDTTNGSYYLNNIQYGGNKAINLSHQKSLSFTYDTRPDTHTKYVGGYKVHTNKRLASISSSVNSKLIHTHIMTYDQAPLTLSSRLVSCTLTDPTGSYVTPLRFDWMDGSPSVFEPMKTLLTLDSATKSTLVYPIDVNASGRNDIVLVSSRYNSDKKANYLHLDVHLTDSNGSVSTSSAPGSGMTSLLYPDQLLAIETSGNGKTDLLHIRASGSGSRTYTLTVLLSTDNGYEVSTSQDFTPESSTGSFYTGDFQGNGCVGLVYIYSVKKDNQQNVRFVQFTSEGGVFTALAVEDGPTAVTFSTTHVVVGDMNGDGQQDVFIASPKKDGTRTYSRISLLQSQNGILKYRSEDPLSDIGKKVNWTSTTAWQAYSTDGDVKTGLLTLSKSSGGYLQHQLMRSTGPTLLSPTDPVVSNITYKGTATLSRTSSNESVDICNTCVTTDTMQLNLFRFYNDEFVLVDGVEQPTCSSGTVVPADLRGVTRSDYLFYEINSSAKLTIRSLRCAGGSNPIDYVSGYVTGLKKTVSITYDTLANPGVYVTSDEGLGSVRAAVNGLSRHVTYSSTLDSNAASIPGAGNRSKLVHFPQFVVTQVRSCSSPAAQSQSYHTIKYTYCNARIDYEGRGWLGFEGITKTDDGLDVVTSTSYHQQFPLQGQISAVSTTEATGGRLVESFTYLWGSSAVNNNLTQCVFLRESTEGHYEGGVSTYNVSTSNEYDEYLNLTKTTISSSELGLTGITTTSAYSNDTVNWILGCKTSELKTPCDGSRKEICYEYLAGTREVSRAKRWISDSVWSIQSLEFDEVGNVTSIKGPGRAQRSITFDSTYSVPTAVTAEVGEGSNPLKETATFDLGLGVQSSFTDCNDRITKTTYDILGRPLSTSEGMDSSKLTVIKKNSYDTEAGDIVYTSEVLCDWDGTSWEKTLTHVDGMGRKWRTEKSRPDDPSTMILTDTEYDAAGRVLKQSRPYILGKAPAFSTLTYDCLSRVLTHTVPPAIKDSSPIVKTYQYGFENGYGRTTETESGGGRNDPAVSISLNRYVLNDQRVRQYSLRPLEVQHTNELGQTVETTFDGFGRALTITDPLGIKITSTYDGLSRQMSRKISNPSGTSPSIISDFNVIYDDENFTHTIENELSGESIVSNTDYLGRQVTVTASDETLTYVYDSGGVNSKGNLVFVSSSKGSVHHFDYNTRSCVTKASLSIDDQQFVTYYEWTPTKVISKVTNPNSTTVSTSFFNASRHASNSILADGHGDMQAFLDFSQFNDPQALPRTISFGNGLVLSTDFADSGAPTSMILAKDGSNVHSQSWQLDAFSMIQSYGSVSESQSRLNSFEYDLGGQLQETSSSDGDASPTIQNFSYDNGGSLLTKGDCSFTMIGWLLDSMSTSDDSTYRQFTYSADGNLTEKKNRAGESVSKMTYDSQGRLIEVDGTTFIYDHHGRLLKSTTADSVVTYYVSEYYEETIGSGLTSKTTYLRHRSGRHGSYTTKSDDQNTQTLDPEVLYYHHDHLGSTVAVSDSTGQIATTYTYDSHGGVTVYGQDVSRYKFSGKEKFGTLYYFGARFFDAETGRFLTLDSFPVSLENATPSSLNLYAFARNDPTNFVDLLGYVPWWHWLVDAALIGVGVAVTVLTDGAGEYIGQILIGAGFGGLTQDLMDWLGHTKGDDNLGWGIQIGLGAAFAAVGLGVGAGIELLATRSFTRVGNQVISAIIKSIGKEKVLLGADMFLSGSRGALSQAVMNKVRGKPLNDDVLQAFVMGFIFTGSTESNVKRLALKWRPGGRALWQDLWKPNIVSTFNRFFREAEQEAEGEAMVMVSPMSSGLRSARPDEVNLFLETAL